MPALLRLVRVAKVTTLIAQAWTILYVVAILGWQATAFARTGIWPELPLSSLVDVDRPRTGEVFATASIAKTSIGQLGLFDGLLQIPVIVFLLLAVSLLGAFYLWLRKTERRCLVEE